MVPLPKSWARSLASFFSARLEAVETFQNAFANFVAVGHLGHGQRFVGDGQVVEDRLAIHVHALDAVLNDDGDLVSKGRIVSQAVGHAQGEHVRVAVLVLQAFAGESGAAGGAAQQEAARAHVGGRPDQVADPLEAEHRVINEERNRVDAVVGVRGAGGDERAHRAGFGDAFFENLAVLGFLVIKERVHVDRLIELADTRVDADLAEQRFHAEGAGLVGNDGDDQLADFRIAQQLRQQAHENHGGRNFAAVGSFVELFEVSFRNAARAEWRELCVRACSRPIACGVPACI